MSNLDGDGHQVLEHDPHGTRLKELRLPARCMQQRPARVKARGKIALKTLKVTFKRVGVKMLKVTGPRKLYTHPMV